MIVLAFPKALEPWPGLRPDHVSHKGAFVRMGLCVTTLLQNFTCLKGS